MLNKTQLKWTAYVSYSNIISLHVFIFYQIIIFSWFMVSTVHMFVQFKLDCPGMNATFMWNTHSY